MRHRGPVLLRLRVSEPARLREFFDRLGVRAEVVEDGYVGVELPDGRGLTIADYLAAWSAAGGGDAVVEQVVLLGEPAPAPLLIRPLLGDLLIRKGLITETQLAEALEERTATGELLGQVLLKRRWLFEDELARTLADQLELPYVNIQAAGIDGGVARMFPAEVGMRVAAIPIAMARGKVRVAFADPTDEEALEAVNSRLADIEVVVSELSNIRAAWRQVQPVG